MIQIPLLAIISGLLSIGVRLTGMMLFTPFLGSAVIPARVKAILVLALTVVLYPSVGHDMGTYTLTQWPLLILMELLIGIGMGIATNLVFEAVQMTGQVLGVQMGYSLINILDPQTQVDTTVMALFYQSIVMLLFLRMDVHYWIIRALGNSFICRPARCT
jgi:flagellar biosynthetic protein FliR